MRTSKTNPTPATPMKRTNFFMPPSLLDGLGRVARSQGGTQADHVRKAVHSYLKRYKVVA